MTSGKTRQDLKVCIVTSAPVSQNPRVVKEADQLSEAGYRVTVIYARDSAWTRPLDEAIVDSRPWRARCVDFSTAGVVPTALRLATGLRVRLFNLLSQITFRGYVAELASSRVLVEQAALALLENADLIIGHNPQALPVVALAARRLGKPFAFDAEDLHCRNVSPDQYDSTANRMLMRIERTCLPECRYLSASAPDIALELCRLYGIKPGLTILNTFRWRDRENLDRKILDRADPAGSVSFHWCSQIIGLDRGLQDAIAAMERVEGRAELHIRGKFDPAAEAVLRSLAERSNARSRIFFHAPVPPDEILSRMAEHDVGLCLEQPFNLNREYCISNKLFQYLLAGNALIATRTRGQARILAACPDAGCLVEPGSVEALAAAMNRLAGDRELLDRSKAAALAAASSQWNWELEGVKLVDQVDHVLGTRS